MRRSPNPVDKHVGSRIRTRRLLVGLSQEKLGEGLGITFQQVQKYERGANRISASRLQQASRVLGVPIEYSTRWAQSMAPRQAALTARPTTYPTS